MKSEPGSEFHNDRLAESRLGFHSVIGRPEAPEQGRSYSILVVEGSGSSKMKSEPGSEFHNDRLNEDRDSIQSLADRRLPHHGVLILST